MMSFIVRWYERPFHGGDPVVFGRPIAWERISADSAGEALAIARRLRVDDGLGDVALSLMLDVG